MARAAAETEAQTFAGLINSNPVMSDAKTLFHSGHGNLAAAGAGPDVTTLDAGRIAMRSQLDYDGETPLAGCKFYKGGHEKPTAAVVDETTLKRMLFKDRHKVGSYVVLPLRRHVNSVIAQLDAFIENDPARLNVEA